MQPAAFTAAALPTDVRKQNDHKTRVNRVRGLVIS
jgi:hypothetical protein